MQINLLHPPTILLHFIATLVVKNTCATRNVSFPCSFKRDRDLEGWDGGGGSEALEGGEIIILYIYIHTHTHTHL